MLANNFKIRSGKFLKQTEKAYIFHAANKEKWNTFSIPKSQILKFEQIVIHNEHTGEDENWIDMSVTQWLWNKAKLKEKLSYYKLSSDVIINNETHFGVNWDYVIMKRRNRKTCFFCHGKLNRSNKTQDHLIARLILRVYGISGGLANNVVPCCIDCNQEKGSLSLEMYRDYVKRMISESGNPKYRVILFTLNKVLV